MLITNLSHPSICKIIIYISINTSTYTYNEIIKFTNEVILSKYFVIIVIKIIPQKYFVCNKIARPFTHPLNIVLYIYLAWHIIISTHFWKKINRKNRKKYQYNDDNN